MAAEAGDPRLPRTRGDGPVQVSFQRPYVVAPPHTRGWTWFLLQLPGASEGSPAHAGMDPMMRLSTSWPGGLPRTRGDGPTAAQLGGLPASAPPHTRGWTPMQPAGEPVAVGSPAHAGMDPSQAHPSCTAHRLPRTRGDWKWQAEKGPPWPREKGPPSFCQFVSP